MGIYGNTFIQEGFFKKDQDRVNNKIKSKMDNKVKEVKQSEYNAFKSKYSDEDVKHIYDTLIKVMRKFVNIVNNDSKIQKQITKTMDGFRKESLNNKESEVFGYDDAALEVIKMKKNPKVKLDTTEFGIEKAPEFIFPIYNGGQYLRSIIISSIGGDSGAEKILNTIDEYKKLKSEGYNFEIGTGDGDEGCIYISLK